MPRTPSLGWRHVEHDDVLGVVGQHAVQVAGVHRLRPPFDERADAGLVVGHGCLHVGPVSFDR